VSKKCKKGRSDSKIISKHSKLEVPIFALRKRPLTTYEALIVYLKEDSNFNYHNISVLLDRNERGIRVTYLKTLNKAKDILNKKLNIRDPNYSILNKYTKLKVPIFALRKRPLTTYEALVVYLKDNSDLNYHTIAILLNRDERDIRKVYFRAIRKQKLSGVANKFTTKAKLKNVK